MQMVQDWPGDDQHTRLENLFRDYARREKEFIARELEHDPVVYTSLWED